MTACVQEKGYDERNVLEEKDKQGFVEEKMGYEENAPEQMVEHGNVQEMKVENVDGQTGHEECAREQNIENQEDVQEVTVEDLDTQTGENKQLEKKDKKRRRNKRKEGKSESPRSKTNKDQDSDEGKMKRDI